MEEWLSYAFSRQQNKYVILFSDKICTLKKTLNKIYSRVSKICDDTTGCVKFIIWKLAFFQQNFHSTFGKFFLRRVKFTQIIVSLQLYLDCMYLFSRQNSRAIGYTGFVPCKNSSRNPLWLLCIFNRIIQIWQQFYLHLIYNINI